MNLQPKQTVTVTANTSGHPFKVGEKLKYLYTNNSGHKFQALEKEEGQPYKKEYWLLNGEFE